MSIGDRIGLPDDVTMGYIIEHLLKVPLTVIETFHSHLEPMDILPKETFKEQVTFSYGHIKNNTNVLLIDGFDDKIDPTRFLSLHCHLYPNLANGQLCSPQALQMNWTTNTSYGWQPSSSEIRKLLFSSFSISSKNNVVRLFTSIVSVHTKKNHMELERFHTKKNSTNIMHDITKQKTRSLLNTSGLIPQNNTKP